MDSTLVFVFLMLLIGTIPIRYYTRRCGYGLGFTYGMVLIILAILILYRHYNDHFDPFVLT